MTGAPSQRLADKVIVITGAGSGIGRSTARLCAAAGARVILLDRDRERGAQTAADIQAEAGVARFLEVELSSGPAVEAALDEAAHAFDGLDGVFNCAGISGRRWGDGPVADCTEAGWDHVLAANLRSVFLVSKHAIPGLVRNGGGSIVNLGSVLGLVGGDDDFATHAYAASKGGVIALSRAMAAYYAKDKIRVNVVCPGLIATPMSQRAQADPQIRQRLPRLQPLTGDFGEPDDVGWAVVYLLSDEARFVTGAVLTVDGGWTVT